MKNIFKEIKKEIRFAKASIYKNIQSKVELRASFFISVLGMAINNIAFLIIWISFGKVAGNMGGWNSFDYILAIGIGAGSFGVAFAFFGGFRNFSEIVSSGSFDKFLLSPKSLILRIGASDISQAAFGDLFFGIVCIFAWILLASSFSILLIIKILWFLFLAALIFFFFRVLINSVAFYFSDSENMVKGLFEMLLTPSMFYGGAFQGMIRNVFIFLIPSMLLGNLPLEIIKSGDSKMYVITFLITVFWVVFSIFVFKKSVKKYESSNFINFG